MNLLPNPNLPNVFPGDKEVFFSVTVNGIGRAELIFVKKWRTDSIVTCSAYRHQDGGIMLDYDKRGWSPQERRQIAQFSECLNHDTRESFLKYHNLTDAAAWGMLAQDEAAKE